MKVKELITYLETIAPISYQESYDNSGLIVGDADQEVTGVIVCLDSIEEVIQEAIAKNCNVVVAHHPIVFSGLKKITGKNYIERTILTAIKNDIVIYAIHTNLDNMLHGVNAKIAERLSLSNVKILSPLQDDLKKIVVFVPIEQKDQVAEAMFAAGAGHIGNYSECSFALEGAGTFNAGDNTEPFVGKKGKRHTEKEIRLEMIIASHTEKKVITAMIDAHPYEEVAYDSYAISNEHNQVGAGMIGELETEMKVHEFLAFLKERMNTACVRYTKVSKSTIKKVAFCGGSGSFLLNKAMAAQADVFVTGDFKYHQFFDGEDRILIADIGHFESEQFTITLLADVLKEKFSTFAIHLTEINTNPINYL